MIIEQTSTKTATGRASLRPVLTLIREIQGKWLMQKRSEPAENKPAEIIALEEVSPEEKAELLRIAATEMYAMRRRRDKYVPKGLMGEPAWDILLALFSSQARMLNSTDLCNAAVVPGTTGLRWLQTLVSKGLITKAHPPHNADQRMIFYSLTGDGRSIIAQALTAMLRG